MQKSLVFIVIVFFSLMAEVIVAQVDEGVIETLTPADFYEKLKYEENSLLVDTRSLSEFKKSRLLNAVHAPSRAILFPLLDEMPKDQAVFVYCGRGFESGIVCKIIHEKGFQHIYNLKGGFYAWRKKDMPLDKEKIDGKKNE